MNFLYDLSIDKKHFNNIETSSEENKKNLDFDPCTLGISPYISALPLNRYTTDT
jgi:hypothetical protein